MRASLDLTRLMLRASAKHLPRLAKRRLDRLHADIERKTGFVFGCTRFRGYTSSGYPIHEMWLSIAPPQPGYVAAVAVKDRIAYFGRLP